MKTLFNYICSIKICFYSHVSMRNGEEKKKKQEKKMSELSRNQRNSKTKTEWQTYQDCDYV